jgi:hypothetical protein
MELSKESTNQLIQLALSQLRQPETTRPTAQGSHPFEIGKNYCIRTVTMIQTGKLVAVTNQELTLEDAAWIADTGRFSEFLNNTEKASDVEPFPSGQVIVGRGALIDACQIEVLPRSVK